MKINQTNQFSQIKPGARLTQKQNEETEIKDQVTLGGSQEKVPEGVHKKWLFMNYIAADCNLKEFQAKNIDNQELVGSDANTHIVAMIDVGNTGKAEATGEASGEVASEGKAQEKSILDWSGARTYYVTKDAQMDKINSPILEEQGQINMTDPKVLTNFIVSTMKKFPSDHVALLMNDHGGGYTGAMSDDGTGHGSFTMPVMTQAIKDAENITGKKIDILGFDACLMADTQAAYEFGDKVGKPGDRIANYLLDSEETEGGPGWTYDNMLNGSHEKGNPKEISNAMGTAMGQLQEAMEKKINVSPEEFCKLVVKCNEEHQKDIPTFSATDLSKTGDLTKAVDDFSKAILKTEEKAGVKQAIMNAEAYGGWQQPKPYADMRDLGHIAKLVEKGVSDPKLKKAAQDIQKAIGNAVMANEHDPQKYANATGLHIYAPVDKPGGLAYGFKDLAFAKDTQWNDAMKEIGNTTVPGTSSEGQRSLEKNFTFSLDQETPDIWPDGTSRK